MYPQDEDWVYWRKIGSGLSTWIYIYFSILMQFIFYFLSECSKIILINTLKYSMLLIVFMLVYDIFYIYRLWNKRYVFFAFQMRLLFLLWIKFIYFNFLCIYDKNRLVPRNLYKREKKLAKTIKKIKGKQRKINIKEIHFLIIFNTKF